MSFHGFLVWLLETRDPWMNNRDPWVNAACQVDNFSKPASCTHKALKKTDRPVRSGIKKNATCWGNETSSKCMGEFWGHSLIIVLCFGWSYFFNDHQMSQWVFPSTARTGNTNAWSISLARNVPHFRWMQAFTARDVRVVRHLKINRAIDSL